MRLRQRASRHVAGWIGGVIEEAEPDRADAEGQADGVLDAAENFVASETGRLVVRGGSVTKAAPTESGGGLALSQMLGVFPFTQTGAVSIGHHVASSKHFLHRLDSALAYFTGVEATSRHDLGWNTATAGRPVVAEFFEKLLIADATLSFAARRPLLSVDKDGVVTQVSQELVGGEAPPAAAPLYPNCVATFAGFVFIAGFDSSATGDAPEMLRHSKIGEDPGALGGFEPLAFARVGAIGERIMALAPGDNLLLVAKQNELYRVADGPTLYGGVGWQFAIQQVDRSRGYGVSSPHGLFYRKPYWYGLGDAGPFRTDGSSLDSLVGARRRTWRRIKALERAWVTFHPERNAILFGVTVTDDPANPTYPSRVLVWDIARDNWMPDWPLGRSVFHAHAISTPLGAATTLSDGAPSAPPGVPSQVFDSNVPTPTGTSFRMTFVPGDPTSQTEVWIRKNSSAAVSVLLTAVAPGLSMFDVGDREVLTLYLVKLRHRKGAAFSDFSAEAGAQTGATGLAAPTDLAQTFTDGVTPTTAALDFTFTAGSAAAQTEVWTSPDNIAAYTLAATLAAGLTGSSVGGGVEGASVYVKVRHKQGDIVSAFTSPVRMFFSSSAVITAPSALAQTVNAETPTTENIQMTFTAGNSDPLRLTEVWRRLPAGVSARVATIASTSFSISQDASTEYLYKVRHRVGGAYSAFTAEVSGYTKLAGPAIIGIAALGQTEIQLTIDHNDDGADLRVYNADTLALLQTEAAQAAGEVMVIVPGLACGTVYSFMASAFRAGWPASLREVFSSSVLGGTDPC